MPVMDAAACRMLALKHLVLLMVSVDEAANLPPS